MQSQHAHDKTVLNTSNLSRVSYKELLMFCSQKVSQTYNTETRNTFKAKISYNYPNNDQQCSYPITIKRSSNIMDTFLHLLDQLISICQIRIRMVTAKVRKWYTVDSVLIIHSKLLDKNSFYVWSHNCFITINQTT